MGIGPGAVEDLDVTPGFWLGRRVFVTGHTGFKGGWLVLCLQAAGAEVHGYSLEPPSEPNLFGVARIAEGLAGHTIGDIRDRAALQAAVCAASPEVVFHLAAQPLVRQSYRDPVETYAVNVLGLVHLLEAVRACGSVHAVLNVTTDKCYENREWLWGYREHEPLGGRDPYSSSKACAEIVTAAYRESFLAAAGVAVATARAGNVIGGGDWSTDRLLPDFFRAVQQGLPLQVRLPDATRPWQHVLDPLDGYLRLAEALTQGAPVARGWNFGPGDDDARPVRWLLDRLSARLPGAAWQHSGGDNVHEAMHLKLDSSQARNILGWSPAWGLDRALDLTVDWHRAWIAGCDMRKVCLAQIDAHRRDAA